MIGTLYPVGFLTWMTYRYGVAGFDYCSVAQAGRLVAPVLLWSRQVRAVKEKHGGVNTDCDELSKSMSSKRQALSLIRAAEMLMHAMVRL